MPQRRYGAVSYGSQWEDRNLSRPVRRRLCLQRRWRVGRDVARNRAERVLGEHTARSSADQVDHRRAQTSGGFQRVTAPAAAPAVP